MRLARACFITMFEFRVPAWRTLPGQRAAVRMPSLLLGLLLGLAPSSPQAGGTDYSKLTLPTLVEPDTRLSTWAVEPVGDLLVGYGDVFAVLDVSDPDRPQVLSTTPVNHNTFGRRHELAVSANLAVAVYGITRHFFDISDPASPVLLATDVGPATFMSFYDGYLLRVFHAGLSVVDVSDPSNPIEVAGIPISNVDAATRLGSLLFITHRTRMTVFDVSDPLSPTLVSETETGFYAFHLTAREGVLYVADTVGLRVMDIRDPTDPVLVRTLPGPSGRLRVMGSQLLRFSVQGVPDHDSDTLFGHCAVYDLRDPLDPVFEGEVPGLYGPAEAVAVDSKVYWFDFSFVKRADLPLRVQKPDSVLGLRIECSSVSVFKHRAFVTGSNGQWYSSALEVLDISDPHHLVSLGRWPTGSRVRASVTDGRWLVLARDYGVALLDVADPDLAVVGELPYNYATAPTVHRDYLFLGVGARLAVHDLSGPPFVELGSVTGFVETIWDACVRGRFGYFAAGEAGIHVVDLSHGPNAEIVGQVSLEEGWEASRVTCDGDFLYAVLRADDARLVVYALEDRQAPRYVGSTALDDRFVYDMLAHDDFVYLPSESWGTQVIDVSVPERPIRAGGLGSRGYAATAIVKDDALLVFDGVPRSAGTARTYPLASQGYLEDDPGPERPTDAPAWLDMESRPTLQVQTASPFSQSVVLQLRVPQAGPGSVRVFDVHGRVVRTLRAGAIEAGVHAVRWDGRDDAGHVVAAGVYFVRLSMPQGQAVRKVVRGRY